VGAEHSANSGNTPVQGPYLHIGVQFWFRSVQDNLNFMIFGYVQTVLPWHNLVRKCG